MSPAERRIAALRRFATGITVLTLAGHLFLGFEQSWAQVLAALATCYGLELALELVDSWSQGRPARFRGGPRTLLDFMLPAHITALAISLLLYATDQIEPFVFASTVAIGSKALFRAPVGKGTRHFLNPSNFGIATTLLVFPFVGIAPPYHFTENVSGAGDWLVPAFVLATGSFLNLRLTGKGPLIAAWLGGFAAQALLRHLFFDASLEAALLPMTGMAFLLFTFYMVTDPGTTPVAWRSQVAFGAGVAFVYSVLVTLHVVFGLFFALVIVAATRGIALHVLALSRAADQVTADQVTAAQGMRPVAGIRDVP
jgi:hypothetical protein